MSASQYRGQLERKRKQRVEAGRCHSVEATLLVLEGGAGGAEGVDV